MKFIFTYIFILISFVSFSQTPQIYGCTDSEALNFDENANTDDGSCCQMSASQNQVGQSLIGNGWHDYFGANVEINNDGNIIAIGAKYESNDNGAGITRVYENYNGSWIQLGQQIDESNLGGDLNSISMNGSGNIVSTSSINFNGGQSRTRIFYWASNIGSWAQMGSDILGDYSDSFGTSISLDEIGHTIAIGAPLSNTLGTNSGKVQIYEWDNSTFSWIQKGNDLGTGFVGDKFGNAVVLSKDGNTVAVGSPLNGDSYFEAGKIQVFRWDGISWNQIGNDINGSQQQAELGRNPKSITLSEDGNTLVVGSPRYDANFISNSSYNGKVTIYKYQFGNWHVDGQEIHASNIGDGLGHSISINNQGDILAIGAPFFDGSNCCDRGKVYIYKKNQSEWVQEIEIFGSSTNSGTPHLYFGADISLNNNGNFLCVGAYGYGFTAGGGSSSTS